MATETTETTSLHRLDASLLRWALGGRFGPGRNSYKRTLALAERGLMAPVGNGYYTTTDAGRAALGKYNIG